MREYTSGVAVPRPTRGSLTDDIVRNATERPDSVAFSVRTGAGWSDVTAASFLRQVRAVAKGLVASGVRPGDRVALMTRTRYEWTLLDYAIWVAGAVTVPVYETSSSEDVTWVLEDSRARAVVVEDDARLAMVEAIGAGLDSLESVWSLHLDAVEMLRSRGAGLSDAELESRRTAVSPDSLATLVYTSGTTGRPKGCLLTHGNLMVELDTCLEQLAPLFRAEDAATLLALPLAHVFARVVQVGAVRAGVRLGHSARITDLERDLREFRPTFLVGVPRIFERLFDTASQRAAADGRTSRFHRGVGTAIAYSQALDGPGAGPWLRARHALLDRLVFAGLRDSWGARWRYAVSGGAPLGDRLAHFYRGIGIPLLEGYGLTESTAAVTVNLPGAERIGTVGRPLPGTGLRIADDGELLVRGPQVTRGYWDDESATARTFDADGWLRTGDLAEIDEEGFVRIVGRAKEILVTAGGKRVAPGPLEDGIRSHPLVGHCMVVGDGRPFVAAVVTLDPEAAIAWARSRHRSQAVEDLVVDPELLGEIQLAVDAANLTVSRAESVRRFTVLPVQWTEDGGQLTPSLKLRRHEVSRDAQPHIDRLFGS